MSTSSSIPNDQQSSSGSERSPVAPTGEQGAPGGDAGDALGDQAAGSAGASAGNTHLLSSQWSDVSSPLTTEKIILSLVLHPDAYSGPVVQSDSYPGAVFSIDWLETGGLVHWYETTDTLRQIERLREAAKAGNEPEPYVLGNQEVLVQPTGIGSGKQQHLSYRIEWPGVMLAFDTRNQDSRQHANFYLKIMGQACLVDGALATLAKAEEIIKELGGTLHDDWVKRIDLALDLPDVDLQEVFLPAFRETHFVASGSQWNAWDGKQGCTGFTIGTQSRCKLNVYDKLAETKKKDELYQLAMQQNRWGGRVPKSATRIEYQLRKPWLDQFCLTTTEHVLKLLPAIVARLTELEKRPFFALTAQAVDRKNKHQSRCPRLPAWIKAVRTFQDLAGEPSEPLKRVQRSRIDGRKGTLSAVGYLQSIAAQSGRCVSNASDLIEFLREQIDRNEITDADLQIKWEKKARKAGTFRESQDFPFGKRSPQTDSGESEACF